LEEALMLIIAFAVIVLAVIAVHYFVVARPSKASGVGETRVGRPVPVAVACGELPVDASLQNGFTWSLEDQGDLLVGAHPLIGALLGSPREASVAVQRGRVEKGQPLIRIRRGHRQLTLPSPVSGKLKEKRRLTELAEESTDWLCRIEAEGLDEESAGWLRGERAREWTQRRYRGIREALMRTGVHERLGVALADGGDLPRGVLTQLDDEEWEAFCENLTRV
jgi:hypothetical protein